VSQEPNKLPHKNEIVKLINENGSAMSKRDIVKAFNIKGDDRRAIKDMLKTLVDSGQLVKGEKQAYNVPGALPTVSMIKITKIDADGDIFAEPMDWDIESQGPIPRIELISNAPMKEGDRALATLKKYNETLYEGKLIRRIDRQRATVMGQVIKTSKGFILKPTHKKSKFDFDIGQADLNGAKPGDLAIAEILSSRSVRNRNAKVTKVIGTRDDVNAISLIALHEAGLHEEFLDKVLQETEGLKVPPLGKREDLRKIPLVTIDGADARDFDDAVYAESLPDGGFHLIVAIADVSYYVRPKSALDKEAYIRGNSTYFPDRVVPMLPEALSNDLCSLRPKEDRACMAFHLWIDEHGELKRQKIVRGLMRSQARLTYEQVQAAKDGTIDDATDGLMKPVINPLYEAYKVLNKAREKRGALDLDLPERQILIDDTGKMTGVRKRARLDAHKLIEEFMILANVAAALALEAKKAPCVYRVHDRPSADKVDNARQFVEAFGISMPKGQVMRPAQINGVLRQAEKTDYSQLISQVVLRTQSQAIYHPENIGHFGLALRRYAHFTSPIRRYADLLVHRSLVSAYGLGEGGLSDEERVTLEERTERISQTERTSSEAERNAVDRFTAAWMSERIGAEFSGVISSVTRFGLFVSLDENGADGLIPMRSLPDDYYVHDEEQHALVGRRNKKIYRLGAPIQIKLKEADGLTGSSLFELANNDSADIPGIKFKKAKFSSDRSGSKNKKKTNYGKKNLRKKKGGSKNSHKPRRK